MNICSTCSEDFAFTKHLHLGSLKDVTKWHLSLTHSSWHIIHQHNWNSILWVIYCEQTWTQCEVVLIWQRAHSIKRRKIAQKQKMFSECKIPRAWTTNIHLQRILYVYLSPRSYSPLQEFLPKNTKHRIKCPWMQYIHSLEILACWNDDFLLLNHFERISCLSCACFWLFNSIKLCLLCVLS